MELQDINICLPAVIVNYDANACRATVRPTIAKRLTDGSELQAPQIVNVPVQFLTADIAGGLAQVTVPLKPNDGVLLIFSQRSLENWLSGSNQAPDDPRMFDLSDAFAIPGINQAKISADPVNLSINYAESSIKITPDGEVIISANKAIINAETEINGNVVVNGNVSATGEVSGKGINLSSHTHKNVQSGNSNTGGPV